MAAYGRVERVNPMESREEKIQGQYVPAEGQYPRVELSAENNRFAPGKRLEEIRTSFELVKKIPAEMILGQAYIDDVSYLLEELERLQKIDYDRVHKSHLKMALDEVSQLREEKDSQYIKICMLEEALRWYADNGNYNVNLIDQWGPHTPVLHDNGKRACWALGIGVDNETP